MKQPVDLPVGSGCLQSAFIEEVDNEDLSHALFWSPTDRSGPLSNTSMTLISSMALDLPDPRFHWPTNDLNEGLGTPDSKR